MVDDCSRVKDEVVKRTEKEKTLRLERVSNRYDAL